MKTQILKMLKALTIRIASIKDSIKVNKYRILAITVILWILIAIPHAINDQPSPVIARAVESTPTTAPTAAKEPDKAPSATQQKTTKIVASTPKPKSSSTPQKPKTVSGGQAGGYNKQENSKEAPKSQSTSTTPVQKPTPAPDPQASGILGLINNARSKNGLGALSYNSMLNIAAQSKSEHMRENNYFSHTSPDGRSDFDFIKAAGYIYTFAGSNIASGRFTEQSVFEAWMNSSGHRANILDNRAKEFGYGVSGGYYTMMVGAR